MEKIPQFSYYDECVMGYFSCWIFRVNNKKAYDLKILCFILALIIVGLIGNMRFGYSRTMGTILSGTLVWFKAFIVYVSFDYILKNLNESMQSTIRILHKAAKLFVIASFVCLVISPVTKYGIELSAARSKIWITSIYVYL